MEKTKVVVCIEKMVEVEVDTNLCQSDGNPEFIAEIEKLVNTPSLFNRKTLYYFYVWKANESALKNKFFK